MLVRPREAISVDPLSGGSLVFETETQACFRYETSNSEVPLKEERHA